MFEDGEYSQMAVVVRGGVVFVAGSGVREACVGYEICKIEGRLESRVVDVRVE